MTDVHAVVAPDDIDVGFVPQLSQNLLAMEVGPETVLLGDYGQALVLNPTAGLVWHFFDGETALADLIDDFSEVLDVDRDTVRTDIVDFARTLGRNGLLQGVAEPIDDNDLAEIDWSPPEPVAVGESIEPGSLTDLDGAPATLETAPDRRVLLVNWSPGCGFCVTTAATLAAAEAGLAAAGIDLILLTTGEPDENRRVLGDAGVAAPALLRAGEDDPFAGFGTPAAYLLDADGRVEEPMAYGANEVPIRVAELAGIEQPGPEGALDTGAVPSDRDDDQFDDVLYLPVSSAVCGPGGGSGAGAGATAWSGTAAYRVGAFHIGVRVNDPEITTVVDRLMPGARVQDHRTPDNFSIALYPEAGRGSRRLNLLVRDGRQLVRSRSAARALAALLTYMSADTSPPDEDLLPLNASAALVEGKALLLPAGLVNWTKQIQTTLARRGIVLVDAPYVTIDVASAELVVPTPSVPHDPEVLAELDRGARLGPELPYVQPGRYPLTTWYLNRSPDEIGPLAPALGVATAYALVSTESDPLVIGRGLAELFERVSAQGVWLDRPGAIDEQLDPGHRS